jgi:signal transduction histidine kinase/ligand-binding sensor domain-containing protein
MRSGQWRNSRLALTVAVWLGLLLAIPGVYAERLPIKTYTTADGLAQNAVNKIVRDSHGFLWFCTEDGLSRYDGYTFTNYGVEQGLPNRRVTDLLETREGEYWVATGGGLCRFNPKGRPLSFVLRPSSLALGNEPKTTDQGPRTRDQGPRTRDNLLFEIFSPGQDDLTRFVTALIQDRSGTVWCGTTGGLFRLERAGGNIKLIPVEIGMPTEPQGARRIEVLCEDRHGTLWLAGHCGLYRRWPDGSATQLSGHNRLPMDIYQTLLEDRQGNVWVGTREHGLFRLMADASHKPPVIASNYTIKDGLNSNWIFDTFESSDGRFWVATNVGLCELIPSGDNQGRRFRTYPRVKGLGYYEIFALAEDQYGNLWMGTAHTGALKLTRSGFTTFGEEDGFTWIASIFEDTDGDLCFVGQVLVGTKAEGGKSDATDPASIVRERRLGQFDGQRFTWLRPHVPKQPVWLFGWGFNQIALQDYVGEWWVMAAYDALYRFPPVNRFEDLKTTRPKAVYTTKDGLPSSDLFRIFEDSRGDIWISCVTNEGGLARWDRATDTWHNISRTEGLPSLKDRGAMVFREDRAGNLWIGFERGALARYRAGQFTSFTIEDGVPAGSIYDLFVDHAGRLWMASTLGGLARLDDPSAERPTFITYTTADGLSSNKATCVAEDRFGRIYVGTARGLDRLDPATGRIKHFTSADGLVPGEIVVLFCDRKGDIWIGNPAGLSRFTPQPDPPLSPPPVLINGLRVAGRQQTISALGETAVALPDLDPEQNQLQIEFVGLSFAPGESLRYQYMLEGADRDWSAPTDQRTVSYASLSPGRYRFLVRAINSEGTISAAPATITFKILRPIWQRWWFLTLAVLLLGLAGYAAYRYRVARLLELERVRTRIATDLHDDIGSNLTRIALLTEVVRQQVRQDDPDMIERLGSISYISRESVDAMSDIIWAINPQRDRLRDLIQRMRRFAEDALNARNIAFRFRAPSLEQDIKLGPDMRREVFLIFKESVNNMVRHSACTEAEIDFQIEGGWLVLKLSDNGKGLDLTHESEGQGLLSMRQRAKKLGGELEIRSPNGQGTTVTLRVPLR